MRISDDTLTVTLADGWIVSVPISWYPRLSHALPQHRSRGEFIGRGHGIDWPELDEDIRVENLLFGQPSGEGARSFSRWRQWYREKLTEQDAAPNGGPAPRPGNSGVTAGPPSVS